MHKPSHLITIAGVVSVCMAGAAIAQQSVTVDMKKITETGVGEKIGTVKISQSKKGLTFAVSLKDIAEGPHGFHVHEKGDCNAGTKDGKAQPGLAAGAHYDPEGKKSHQGPMGSGHKGDLPVLNAGKKGVKQTVTAPHLKMADVQGRSLMVHQGGDNYTDNPENGGGAGRIACGVIPKS